MSTINWGIIGCGDVTEKKSGPAFNKVPNSKLVAVMRRNGALAKDYAERHSVPKWYVDGDALINDPEVNAIYIATPPDSHLPYAIAAMQAGKPVYVEKPMTLNYAEALAMADASEKFGQKLVVAHYRRGQAYFNKIKQLISKGGIGDIRFATLSFFAPPLSAEALQTEKTKWRVEPAIAGGGIFHDLAPHQLDLAYWFLGEPVGMQGFARNQMGLYKADDIVSGTATFASGAVFTGTWCFGVAHDDAKDEFEIYGSEGSLSFSVFGRQQICIRKNGRQELFDFEPPEHVQQPMIENSVRYFLGQAENPCSARQAAVVMRWIDAFAYSKT